MVSRSERYEYNIIIIAYSFCEKRCYRKFRYREVTQHSLFRKGEAPEGPRPPPDVLPDTGERRHGNNLPATGRAIAR